MQRFAEVVHFFPKILLIGHLLYLFFSEFMGWAKAFFRPFAFASTVAGSTCDLDSLVIMAFMFLHVKAFLAYSWVKLLPALLAGISCDKSTFTIYLSAAFRRRKFLTAKKRLRILVFEWCQPLFEMLSNLIEFWNSLFAVFGGQISFDFFIQLWEGLLKVLFQSQQELISIMMSLLHNKNDTNNTINTKISSQQRHTNIIWWNSWFWLIFCEF